MPKTPLAPALRVFQTLQRYPIIRPRQLPDVPVGCTSAPVSVQAAQQSILSLYHDLGVLVFAGSNVKQTERIGDLLRQVVAWKGPGGALTRVGLVAEEGYQRFEALGKQGLHETVDESRAGQIKPDAILKMASSRFQQMLQNQAHAAELGKLHFQEIGVIIPAPTPSGTIIPAENGPRTLSLDSYATISMDRDSGNAIGEIRFFAVGTGDYVGAARIEYEVLRLDEEEKRLVPLTEHVKLETEALSADVQRQRFDEIGEVLEKLWELEREVWAHRVEELE